MKLRNGLHYKTRDGRKVGPVNVAENGLMAHSPGFAWTVDGMSTSAVMNDPNDIVAEWRVEVGARYLTRNGFEVGPLVASSTTDEADELIWPVSCEVDHGDGDGVEVEHWRADGSYDPLAMKAHDLDLVREWGEDGGGVRPVVGEAPPVAPAAVLAILDRAADAEAVAGIAPPNYGKVIRPLYADDGFEPLVDVLRDAHDQSAKGKGRDRHGRGLPFMDQPIIGLSRIHGSGFATGQAAKKLGEAAGMLSRGEHDAAVRELLGAIVYAAAAVIVTREAQQ